MDAESPWKSQLFHGIVLNELERFGAGPTHSSIDVRNCEVNLSVKETKGTEQLIIR